MKHYDEAIAGFLANRPIVTDPSLPEALKMIVQGLGNPDNLPFVRELWEYSLPEHIARVDEPILVVIGKKDLQTDWKLDGRALEDATAHKATVSYAYPEKANHVMKREETPREKLTAQAASQYYNSPDAGLDEEATSAIFNWLNEHRNHGTA
jgi:hypothetical protein